MPLAVSDELLAIKRISGYPEKVHAGSTTTPPAALHFSICILHFAIAFTPDMALGRRLTADSRRPTRQASNSGLPQYRAPMSKFRMLTACQKYGGEFWQVAEFPANASTRLFDPLYCSPWES
jgi:hypothetical protein